MSVRICILVADKLGEMHVVVPYDLWKRADFIVELVSIEKKNTIILENGVKISCQHSLDKTNLSQYNAIYLPGGSGYLKFLHPKTDPKLKKCLIKDFYNKENKWILGSCSSPKIINEWKLNGENKMTCSEEFKEEIINSYVDEPVCVSGNIITSNGPGNIMDFAFKVIEILGGLEVSEAISKKIKYKKN